MVCSNFVITEREEIARGVFDFRIYCPEICSKALPGQFCHIGVPGFSLRRPISICGIDKERGELRVVFEVRGEGTRALSQLTKGENIDLLAPLGKGFTLLPADKRAAVIGGGIGVPPLLEVARHYRDNCNAVLGFRDREHVLLDLDFASVCDTVTCTDDGSYGVEGTVLPALESLLQGCALDIIYACGPRPMLREAAALAARYGVRMQVSMEERMGCGVGACLTCSCKIHGNGGEQYARVCKDGPVFESADIIWD